MWTFFCALHALWLVSLSAQLMENHEESAKDSDNSSYKNPKLFNPFQIVSFPNDNCVGDSR